MLETDPSKLIGKLDSAWTTLCASLLELDASGERGRARQRLIDALKMLDMVRRTELKIPLTFELGT
jgi:hypothetical protein